MIQQYIFFSHSGPRLREFTLPAGEASKATPPSLPPFGDMQGWAPPRSAEAAAATQYRVPTVRPRHGSSKHCRRNEGPAARSCGAYVGRHSAPTTSSPLDVWSVAATGKWGERLRATAFAEHAVPRPVLKGGRHEDLVIRPPPACSLQIADIPSTARERRRPAGDIPVPQGPRAPTAQPPH